MKVLLRKLLLSVLMLLVMHQLQAQIKVACIGDSITEGAGIKDEETNYPEYLQILLGQGYKVENFGNSGKTMTDGDQAYLKTKEYKNALAFKPNIVIIMLGTNDTKPDRWPGEDKFYTYYKSFIENFQSLPETQEIYICYPVRAFNNNFRIRESVLKLNIIPAIKLVGRRTDVNIIDLYSPFFDKALLLPDGVHPNEEGARLIASEIFKVIAK